MNLEDFSKLNNVTLVFDIHSNTLLQRNITNVSIIAFSGSLFWVQKDDFVFIIKDFISDEALKKIIIALISKKIMGCCIIHSSDLTTINTEAVSLFSLNSLPLFHFVKGSPSENFWRTVLFPIIREGKILSFFEQQLKNNIICLMNSEDFNVKNLTSIVSLFLQNEVFLFSKQFHLLCFSSPVNDKASSDLPFKKWSEELSGWNINQSSSLEPVVFDHNGCEYYCFSLKSFNNIIGYLCIEKFNQKWGNLNTFFIVELLPYFILCMVSTSKNELMHHKSMEEHLQNVLYGLYTDEGALKAEATYYNFEYYLDRYVWILQIEPLNKKKYTVENNVPDAVLAKAKHLSMQVFYNNMFLTQKSQIVSIHIKSEKNNEKVLEKFQMILNDLELQCPEYSFYIGISRAYSDMYKLRYAYEDATFSLIMGKTLFSNTNKKTFCYDDLLIYHLLYQQIDNPILDRLYNNTIKKIKLYDLEKQDQLYETLNELINCDFNLTQAHENLYLHRNTLYQRIKKIEKIIGFSTRSLETKLLLQLGLKLDHIHNVINQRNEKA